MEKPYKLNNFNYIKLYLKIKLRNFNPIRKKFLCSPPDE